MTMTPIFSSLMDSITTESLVWWLSRTTLIAALACAYLALARRTRPATRHMVAVGSLVAMAFMPAVSALLPTLPIPVLPASPPSVATPPAPRGLPSAIDAPALKPTPATNVTPPTPATIETTPRPARNPVAAIGRALWTAVRTSIGSMGWKVALLLTWLTVTACLLLWTGIGAFGAWRLSRRAPSVYDEELLDECARAERVLGIRRTVDVGVSPDVVIPMVVGALRPRVVIPTSAAGWSRERLRVVMLHELAHVARRDGLWMLVARVVASVFWFQPLSWVLSSHARRDAERACDEIVLDNGIRGSDYAEHLVAIARSALSRGPLAGSVLAFATRSSLEGRVVAILATRVPREKSKRAVAALACGSLGLLILIASARPTPVASAQVTTMDALAFETRTGVAAIDASEPAPDYKLALAPAEETGAETRYYLADDDEDSGRHWYSKGSDLYDRHRYERAAEAYEKAAELGYRSGTALYNAGCSYALAKQPDQAITALRGAFDEGFDDPEQYAEDEDLNSLRADPRFQKLMNDVMNSGEAESERRGAMRDYERLAKRSNVDEGDWNSVGMELLRSGDYEHAADAFNNEFKVSQDEDALYNVACARALQGQKDAAFKLLEQSITTGSINAEHMSEDPDLMTLHGDKRFDSLLSLAEDLTLWDGSWWNGNGKWSWNNGDDEKRWRKSIPHFEGIAQAHPQIGRAWFNLGYAQLLAEEPDASTPSFQKALDLGYRPSTTMYNLACSNAQSGNIDAAFGWLEKAEGAGMQMWSQARWDDDLDPLRSDPRYKPLAKKWRAEAKAHDKDDDYDWERDRDDDT